MIADEKIKNSNELEFAVFCIENVAAKLGVNAERVYQAFTEKSDILNGYIVPEYEVLHTQSREDELKVLKFDSYSEEWLDFILNCRSGKDMTDYDIVLGGVANDKVFNTVELFFDGLIDKAEAINHIKEDRTPEDLLFQVMLDLGVLLSSKIEETTIAGKKVFNLEDNYLIACFDDNVTDEVITEIAKQQPYYFVMRDSSMASDSVATNFEQIFATYSPSTERRVL